MSNKQTSAIAKQAVERTSKGTFVAGVSGNPGGASRARRELNADTIRAMHAAFREGGRAAIDKVMKQSPAIFLKLLVLLVPRELEVTHTGGVKAMTDEQLEAGIEAIQAMLAARENGDTAKVVNAIAEDAAPVAVARTTRKAKRDMGESMGSDSDSTIS